MKKYILPIAMTVICLSLLASCKGNVGGTSSPAAPGGASSSVISDVVSGVTSGVSSTVSEIAGGASSMVSSPAASQ